jgi:hypothetical protein
MNNKKLMRLALAGGAAAALLALARNRSTVIGLLPRSLKDAVKESTLYQSGTAALNRRHIADIAAKGELFTPPSSPEEITRIIQNWKQRGRPIPGPGPFKQTVLFSYGQEFGLETLIETGTFAGDTPAALKHAFRRIYSIELNPELVRRVQERFREDAHISILHGDSEKRLPEILAGLREPRLFWLDGHDSGGVTALGPKVTPILGELEAVLAHPVPGHVLLIDDARDFRRDKGHPTLEELQAFIAARRPDLRFAVEDDIIRVTPSAGLKENTQ